MAGTQWPTAHPTGLAPRRVPDAYVRAEIAAFPLTSLESFRNAIIALDPELDEPRRVAAGSTTGPTLRLWRACEHALVENASGWSLDRLIAVRDLTWFGDAEEAAPDRGAPGQHVWMHEYLCRLAEAHVEPRHGVTELCHHDGSRDEALTRYRWLNFALPEDLLLAAVPITPPPTRVQIEAPRLVRRLLDQGVAEIHQHAGAGLDFPLLWTSALAAVADPEVLASMLTSPGVPFHYSARELMHPMEQVRALEGGERLLRWLLVGALVRLVLAAFLRTRQRGGDAGMTFVQFLRHGREQIADVRNPLRVRDWLTICAALRALTRTPDEDPPGLDRLRALYARLHPTADQQPKTLDEVWHLCDPIAFRLRLHTPDGGERWLVRHGLRYLYAHPRDCEFARAFWQVMRIRCIYYRFVVQRPLTAGLQWFIRFYDRIHALAGPLRSVRAEAIYRVASDRERIAALEIRASGAKSAPGLAEELSSFLSSWKTVLQQRASGDEPEVGVVVEFLKGRDPKGLWERGRPKAFGSDTHAEPRLARSARRLEALATFGGRLRFAEYILDEAARAEATGDLLTAVPLMLWLVRGVDVASDELSVPTWALVPLYEHVRRSAAYASLLLPDAERAPPIRTTVHVGEDFVHLMQGMRRIFEAIRYLLPNSGGRLGHATALGVDPARWGESVGAVLMPAEDRLWDLVFEWRLYAGYHVGTEFVAAAPPGRQQWLANHIVELARDILGRTVDPRDLAELHHELHRFMLPPPGASLTYRTFSVAAALRHFTHSRSRAQRGCAHRLREYLEDFGAFRRAQRPVDVIIDQSEVAALSAVQNALRRGVGARGIVVEVNPTSNLLIGDMLDLRHHPILRLYPIEPSEDAPPVPIAIGSDDPITFSTSLLREYAMLHHAACAAGYGEDAVQGWLERVRQVSMDARFTVAWKPDARTMSGLLLEKLDRYLQRPTKPSLRRRASRLEPVWAMHATSRGEPP